MDSLPSEIIAKIVDNLSDIRDVKNFSLVNKNIFNNFGVVKRLTQGLTFNLNKFPLRQPIRCYTNYNIGVINSSQAIENFKSFLNYVKKQENMFISEIVFRFYFTCSIKKIVQSDQTITTSCILNDNYSIINNDIFKSSAFINITDITLDCLCSDNFSIITKYKNQLEKLDIKDFKLNVNQFNQFCQMPKLKHLNLCGEIEIYNEPLNLDMDYDSDYIDISSSSEMDYDSEDLDDELWYSDCYTTLRNEEQYKEYKKEDVMITSAKTQLDYFGYHQINDYGTETTSWKVFKQFLPILTQVKTINLKENRLCGLYLLKDDAAFNLLTKIEHLSIWFIEYPLKMLTYISYDDYMLQTLPKKIAKIDLKSSTLKSFEVNLSINYTHICLKFPKNLYLSHISTDCDFFGFGGFKIPIETFLKKMKEAGRYYKFITIDSKTTFTFYSEKLYIEDSCGNFTDNYYQYGYNKWTGDLIEDYISIFLGMRSFKFYFLDSSDSSHF